jgi:hypothetical protein
MRPNPQFALSDGSPLTRQEHFVLKQAASVEIADLEQKFGGAEEERRLRARFLEKLLTGDFPFYLYLVAVPEDLRLDNDPHHPGCCLYQA